MVCHRMAERRRGRGGGGGNPGEILTFQVFKCQFPYHSVSIRSQIVLLQKISIPLPWKVFFMLEFKFKFKNDMMIQLIDKPSTAPIGRDRETFTFKALLYEM